MVGALAGSIATIVVAPRLIKVTPTGNSLVAPLAPINNTLTEESAVINVANQDGKAVVEIKTTITSADTFLQQEQHGIGSGFIVRSDGYIVTNNHVVENADKITVTFYDGVDAAATVVGLALSAPTARERGFLAAAGALQSCAGRRPRSRP